MTLVESLPIDLTYYPVVLASFVFFFWICLYLSPWISLRLCSGYKHLTVDKQINWHSRVTSNIHAVIISALCVYCLIFDADLRNDPIWNDNLVVRASCAMVVGYMLFDVTLVLTNFKALGEVGIVIHHLASMYAFFYVMSYGVLPFFAIYRLTAEFSTPLINNRWMFSSLGYKITDTVVFVNGWTMAAVFFLCRIAAMPYYWYKIYLVYNTPAYIKLGHMQYVLIGTCIMLDILNFVWFYKMCNGIVRILNSMKDANRNIVMNKEE